MCTHGIIHYPCYNDSQPWFCQLPVAIHQLPSKLSTLATRPSTCFSTDQPEFSNTLMFFQTSPLPTSRDVSDICGIFLRFSRGVPLLRPLEWLRGRGNLQFCIADLRIGTFVNYWRRIHESLNNLSFSARFISLQKIFMGGKKRYIFN